jgi:hypothetical protein
LKNWRRQVSDPFLDNAFVKRFNGVYRKNYELWQSLGGAKMKDKDALDFSEFIPDWDPAPYLGMKDR